jgi:hypothetical protein
MMSIAIRFRQTESDADASLRLKPQEPALAEFVEGRGGDRPASAQSSARWGAIN